MSSSSFESQRSIRSSASLQSAASYRSGNDNHVLGYETLIRRICSIAIRVKDYLYILFLSAASNSSWWSIGSFSNFQAGGIMDPKAMNRAPRVRIRH